MKEIGTGIKNIWKEDRRLLVMMIILAVMGLAFMIFSLVTLEPAKSVTKIGYSDIGGYKDGSWQNMLAWPLFGLTLGIMNNLIAVKVFNKNGVGMAKILVGGSMMLMVMGLIVLVRLIGEA